jgi:hypothetical protein
MPREPTQNTSRRDDKGLYLGHKSALVARDWRDLPQFLEKCWDIASKYNSFLYIPHNLAFTTINSFKSHRLFVRSFVLCINIALNTVHILR